MSVSMQRLISVVLTVLLINEVPTVLDLGNSFLNHVHKEDTLE